MDTNLNKEILINIREMREGDIEAALAIDHKITGKNRALTYLTFPRSYIGGLLEISVVAEANGVMVGFLLGRIADSPRGAGDVAWVQLIGIDPEFRRQGIGTSLVKGFMECCQQKGVQSMHIMVSWHDWWFLSFLKSLGFLRGETTEFMRPID